MQPKSSPGPWKINGPSRLRDDSAQIVDAEGETVTHVIADDTQEIEDGSIAEVLSTKAKANARLIAAAPDLYAALTAYRSVVAMLPVRMMQDLAKWKGFTDAQIAGAVALAKAEGRDA